MLCILATASIFYAKGKSKNMLPEKFARKDISIKEACEQCEDGNQSSLRLRGSLYQDVQPLHPPSLIDTIVLRFQDLH